jgi:hypothetical protein
MTAAIEAYEVDSIEAIRLAAIAGLTGDERRCNNLAMESVALENALENEAGAGGFVARPYRPSLGETTKQPADLVEISRELDDLGMRRGILNNSGGYGIEMHIKTNIGILVHGWIPPNRKVKCQRTLMCALLRYPLSNPR